MYQIFRPSLVPAQKVVGARETHASSAHADARAHTRDVGAR